LNPQQQTSQRYPEQAQAAGEADGVTPLFPVKLGCLAERGLAKVGGTFVISPPHRRKWCPMANPSPIKQWRIEGVCAAIGGSVSERTEVLSGLAVTGEHHE
jgi:hypothetical protein